MSMLNTELQKNNNLCEQIRQAMHDIRSPLACLKILNATLTSVGEEDKYLLDNSTERIIRIIDSINDALEHPINKKSVIDQDVIDINSIVEKILCEKRSEYHNLDVEFCSNVEDTSRNLSILGSMGDFERMLSNIINNAVDAFSSNPGKVSVDLKSDDYYLYLTISDNGKGMPSEVLEKLRNNIAVTYGKDNGHGIGFTQITNTVKKLNGEIAIDSNLGIGSIIFLKFLYLKSE